MDRAMERFLAHRVPDAEEVEIWGDGTMPLRVTAYLTAEEPPSSAVTSVRGLVFRDESVRVVWDENGEPYILPGGRGKPGESLQETLYREVLEEAGAEVRVSTALGFLWFHHLGPKPAGYLYPYPDFLQVVYLAWARAECPEARVHDEGVTSIAFYARADVETLPLRDRDRLFLAAALALLSDRAL